MLEGESLLNDASSLIIFRFALIAVATGQFIWYEAALDFVWMVIGGVGIGLLIGWIAMLVHKHLPTDVNTDIVLTLVTPFVMYTQQNKRIAQVLAVGRCFISKNRHRSQCSSRYEKQCVG